VKGSRGTQVDYIDVKEQIILDAKYKPRYEKGDIGITADVREISGYARDKKILKTLKWDANVVGRNGKLFPDCVIIYPVIQVEENDNGELPDVVTGKACSCKYEFDKNASIIRQCDEIKAFEGIYKIAIPMPKKANEPLAN
jgi:5-methylcytosine-specific restriction enzyme subunit McrC